MNNKSSVILILAFAVCVASCSHKEDAKERMLQHVDSIMNEHPDSALALLRHYSVKDFPSSASRAKYALLLTQANDKNYIVHTNDSIIRLAVQHYDSTKEVDLQGKAHYYMGRVHQDMEDQIGAAKEYIKALPYIEKSKDDRMNSLWKNNMAYLLYECSLYEEADSLYCEATKLDEKLNDLEGVTIDLMKRADICLEKNKPDYQSAEKYLLRAYSLTGSFKNTRIRRNVIFSMSSLYEFTKRYMKSIMYARQSVHLLSNKALAYGEYVTIGEVYTKLGQYDSATIYLNKSLVCNNNYTKRRAYTCLAQIARKQNRLEDALRYEECYAAYKDSTNAQEHPTEVTAVIKDMLHKQDKERYESTISHYTLLVIVTVVLLLLTTIVLVWNHRRKEKKIELLNRKVSEEEEKQKQMTQSVAELLNEHKNKEKLLEEQLERKASQWNQGDIHEMLRRRPVGKRLSELCSQKGVAKSLSDEEWVELMTCIDEGLPEFVPTLQKKYPHLSDSDIRLCCLVRLGYRYSQIALIYGVSPQSVYQSKNRVLRRIGMSEDTKLDSILFLSSSEE